MPRGVIDTNILIQARRSRAGTSNALLLAADEGMFQMLAAEGDELS